MTEVLAKVLHQVDAPSHVCGSVRLWMQESDAMEYLLRRWERGARRAASFTAGESVLGMWPCTGLEPDAGDAEPDWAAELRQLTVKSFGTRGAILILTTERLLINGTNALVRLDLAHLGTVREMLPNVLRFEVLISGPPQTDRLAMLPKIVRLAMLKHTDAPAARAAIEEARTARWRGLGSSGYEQFEAGYGEDVAHEMQARWILADPTRGAQAAAAMTLGYQLAERDNVPEAESLFRQVLAELGSGFAAGAAEALGDLLSKAGDDQAAEAVFRQALALGLESDRRPSVWLRVGTLAAARSDFRSAREAFDTVLDDVHAESLHAEAIAALGKLYENNGDTSAAEANYRLLAGLADPTWTPIGQIKLAVLLHRAGDIDGATDQYRAALTGGHPRIAPAAGIDLAALLRDRGQTEEAINIYRQVIALDDPKQTPKAWLRLGDICRDRGDVGQARHAYSRAIDSAEPVIAARARKALGALK